MNQAGRDYCSKQAKAFSAKVKTLGVSPAPSFDTSQIVERVMRLGLEAKHFDLELPLPHNPFELTEDLEQMAIATLKADYARNV
jgi:hypothetical protein